MSLSTWFFVFLPVSCLVLVHLTFFSGTGALHPFSWHVHTTWAFSLWSSWCYFYWSSHMFLCHLCYFYWSSHMFFVTGATSTDPLTCSFVTCATSTDPLTCSLSLVLLLLILSHVLCHWCYFYWSSHMFLCHLCYFYWSSHMFFVTGATSTDPLTCSLSLVLLLLILSHVPLSLVLLLLILSHVPLSLVLLLLILSHVPLSLVLLLLILSHVPFFVTGATSTDPLTCSFLCHWCYFYWSSHMFVSDFIHASIAASSSHSPPVSFLGTSLLTMVYYDIQCPFSLWEILNRCVTFTLLPSQLGSILPYFNQGEWTVAWFWIWLTNSIMNE